MSVSSCAVLGTSKPEFIQNVILILSNVTVILTLGEAKSYTAPGLVTKVAEDTHNALEACPSDGWHLAAAFMLFIFFISTGD